MRNEDPPNKEVHAEDLTEALSKLRTKLNQDGTDPTSPVSPDHSTTHDQPGPSLEDRGRPRSGSSTVIYHPGDDGSSSYLPAVMVEDTTESPETSSLKEASNSGINVTPTARPPVELMEDAA